MPPSPVPARWRPRATLLLPKSLFSRPRVPPLVHHRFSRRPWAPGRREKDADWSRGSHLTWPPQVKALDCVCRSRVHICACLGLCLHWSGGMCICFEVGVSAFVSGYMFPCVLVCVCGGGVTVCVMSPCPQKPATTLSSSLAALH